MHFIKLADNPIRIFVCKDTKNIDMLNVIFKISTIKVQLFVFFYLYSNKKPL